jgi:hypothetical protein
MAAKDRARCSTAEARLGSQLVLGSCKACVGADNIATRHLRAAQSGRKVDIRTWATRLYSCGLSAACGERSTSPARAMKACLSMMLVVCVCLIS